MPSLKGPLAHEQSLVPPILPFGMQAPGTPDAAEIAQLRLAAAAALELGAREAKERWITDPWTWFMERATLLDPLAEGDKIAPYPNFDYLKALVAQLAAYNQLIGWKSRRVLGSWTGILYAVRLCTLFPHVRCFFISRKEGDSDGEGSRELVWRAAWATKNLRNGPIPRMEAGRLHLFYPDTESSITGVTSEPDQMRQVSANFVLCDEFGFWPDPKASYAALKPTLESRGKIFAICSSAEGFFKEIVLDQDEGEQDSGARPVSVIPGRGIVINDQFEPERAPRDIEGIRNPAGLYGFVAWTNAINGFRVAAMHYSADPRKQSVEWREREQQGVPRSIWLTEYEMQLGIRPGKAVFQHEWVPELMLVPKILLERARPVLIGLDFGLARPALVAAQLKRGVQLCILRAHQGDYVQFERFFEECLALLHAWFPTRSLDAESGDFLWCCDRMGDVEKSTGAAEVQIMKRKWGIRPKFKPSLIPPTIDLLRGYMTRVDQREPCFLVERNATTALIVEALNGRYVYPERAVGSAADVPVKDNIVDHQMDCIRYIVLNYGGRAASREHRASLREAAAADLFPARNYVL